MNQKKLGFNKIRLGGLSADLRAYAYSIDENEGAATPTRVSQPVGERQVYLWYLDMVGSSRETIKAIWAGLVNSPPQPVVIYREDANEAAEATVTAANTSLPTSSWAFLAPSERAGGYRWVYAALRKACAHQGIVIPQTAFAKTVRKTKRPAVPAPVATAPTNDQAQDDSAVSEIELPGEEFLLLHLPEFGNAPEEYLREVYFRRVDAVSRVPLLPLWTDWLWKFACDEAQRLCEPLAGYGCEAWLCRAPGDKALAAALKTAIEAGTLQTTSSTFALIEEPEKTSLPVKPKQEVA